MILDERYAPITSIVGFIEAPLDAVAEALITWRRSLAGGRADRLVWEPVDQPFPEVLHRLEPLTTGMHPRELLLATRNGRWTAYFDNGIPWPDPDSRVGHLTMTHGWRGVIATAYQSSQGEGRGRLGAVGFKLLAHHRTEWLNVLRSVGVAAQSERRWTFHSQGEVLPFEQTERYAAPRVPDRFTPEMLREYCAVMKIDLYDPGFYGPRGWFLDNPNKRLPAKCISVSLAEAQRIFGITPPAASA